MNDIKIFYFVIYFIAYGYIFINSYLLYKTIKNKFI